MVSNDFFVCTKTKGSILHRADGSSIVLNEIPENVVEIWKEGSDVFSLRKSGASLLDHFSKEELEKILEKRLPNNINVELQLLRKAIKDAK